MSDRKAAKPKTRVVSYDPDDAPPRALEALIDNQVDDYVDGLLEEDDELPKVTDMMRGLFLFLHPYDKKLKGIAKESLSSGKGIGKALYDALRNVKRRHDNAADKGRQSAEKQSLQPKDDNTSSDPEEPNPNIPKILTDDKPIIDNKAANVANDHDMPANEPQQLPNVANADPKKNKTKHKTGKFAKWKELVEKSFEQVDEDSVQFMFFELHGVDSKVTITRGRQCYGMMFK